MAATRRRRSTPGPGAVIMMLVPLVAGAVVMSGCGSPQQAAPTAAQPQWRTGPLAAMRGGNRAALVFAPDRGDRAFQQQMEWFASRRVDLRERDVAVFELPSAGTPRINGEPAESDAVEQLERQFDVPAGSFTLILIGKNGQPLLRSLAPIPPYQLFEIIDAAAE